MSAQALTTVFLIPSAQTSWDGEDRLQGNIDLPTVNPEAIKGRIPTHWPPASVKQIFCSPDEASRQVAAALASPCRAKVKPLDGLAEINFGIWQGLRRDEIRERYPRAFAQWRNEPGSVSIPSGETLDHLCTRLAGSLRPILEKANGNPIVLVLRPMVRHIVQQMLRHEPVTVPFNSRECGEPVQIEVNGAAWMSGYLDSQKRRTPA